jgi:hypothetical protein
MLISNIMHSLIGINKDRINKIKLNKIHPINSNQMSETSFHNNLSSNNKIYFRITNNNKMLPIKVNKII